MFEKNTAQVNKLIAKMFAFCSIAVLALAVLSWTGVFEFGRSYTLIVLIAGLIITVSPSLLIKKLPDKILRNYMLIALSVFIGVLGTNNHIGIYITYALVPIFSCLYFDPKFTRGICIFSYFVMAAALYVNSADKYEVLYEGRSRIQIYTAYLIGFTFEYVIVGMILYYLVKRARKLMEERYSAEEENKMKTRFLSAISHELRIPMNAVIGMTDVAMRQEMSEDLKKSLTVIRSSSADLLELINDVLDISKIEAGKFSVIENTYSVEKLADEMKMMIGARNIDNKVPIYYHIQENMPSVLTGDSVKIKQVMLNFATNAIKYTSEGRIDVFLGCEENGEGSILLNFSVKDTGQGIRSEDMGKLFTMYSRLDPSKNYDKEGSGIGLAISKYFIDAMKGTVNAESVYGEGSKFSFSVPQKLAEPSELAKAETNSVSSVFRTRDVRILIADDNELNREVVKAVLEPLAMTFDEAKNGLEAVNMAGSVKYDLIFMDSHMPVMSGEEATKTIRSGSSSNRDIPIIALTADAVSSVKERLISSGMTDYIVKPIDIAVIFDVIRKYLPDDKIIDK